MSKNNIFQSQKAQTMLLYHSDGALDIVAGAVLLNLGLDVINQVPTTSLFTWIPILLLTSIKRRFMLPRLGLQALGGDEKRVNNWTIQSTVGLAVGLLLISLLLLGDVFKLQQLALPAWLPNPYGLAFGLAGALCLFIGAWLIPLRRFFIYAAVSLAAGLLSGFLLPSYAAVFLLAAVMVGLGVRVMLAFMRRYPEPEKPADPKPPLKKRK